MSYHRLLSLSNVQLMKIMFSQIRYCEFQITFSVHLITTKFKDKNVTHVLALTFIDIIGFKVKYFMNYIKIQLSHLKNKILKEHW